MRSPLPKKQIEWSEYFLQRPDKIAVIERVLYFDPTELYERLGDKLITSKRHAGISMDLLFPKIPANAPVVVIRSQKCMRTTPTIENLHHIIAKRLRQMFCQS